MKNNFSKIIGNWFLLLGFVAAFAARESHHLFAHAHEEKLSCRDTRPGESHIHDTHFAAHDCDLCGFLFAAAELPDFQWFVEKRAVFFSVKFTSTETVFSDWRDGSVSGRGPPRG